MKVVVDVGASIPTRAHKKTDAGLDLCSTKSGWILPKELMVASAARVNSKGVNI